MLLLFCTMCVVTVVCTVARIAGWCGCGIQCADFGVVVVVGLYGVLALPLSYVILLRAVFMLPIVTMSRTLFMLGSVFSMVAI